MPSSPNLRHDGYAGFQRPSWDVPRIVSNIQSPFEIAPWLEDAEFAVTHSQGRNVELE